MPAEDSKGEDEECLGSMRQAQRRKNTQNGNPKNAASDSQARSSRTSNNNSKLKVKKEEPQSSDDDELPINRRRPSKVCKEENGDDDEESKPMTRRAPASSSSRVVKGKELSSKKVEKTKEPSTPLQNGKKKERKVYGLPGQKRDPPEERDPLRIFYESLYQQVPDSEMAQWWMMESGLLAKEVAQKIFEKKQKKNPRFCSPMKASPASKNTKSTSTKKKKKKMSASPPPASKRKRDTPKQATKRKLVDGSEDDDSDDDFVMQKTSKKQKAS